MAGLQNGSLRTNRAARPAGPAAARGVPESGELAAVAREICCVGRRMWLRQLCAGREGNVSARLADGLVVCTPTGVSKGRMRPSMLHTLTPDGRPLGPPREPGVTSEVQVHLTVYRERPDVRAVVHSHPPHATAFAFAGLSLPEGVYPEADAVLGRVAVAPYALAGTAALAQNVARSVGRDTTTVLLAHHGVLTLSTASVEDAYARLEVLEAYCEMLFDLAALGRVEVLSADHLAELAAAAPRLSGRPADLRYDTARRLRERSRAALRAIGIGDVRDEAPARGVERSGR